MKKLILLSMLCVFSLSISAQVNVNSERSVLDYLSKNKFSTTELGAKVNLSYGYISSYNTYGIILSNSQGSNYFINVNVRSGYGYAEATGMNTQGQDFTVKITSRGDVSAGGVFFYKE